MLIRLIKINFFLLLNFNLLAQLGGINNFESVTLASNAQLIALGGVNITQSRNVNLLGNNPSLLNEDMCNFLVFDMNLYYANIIQNNLTYILKIPKLGLCGLSFKSISYGKLKSYDVLANQTGTFNAFDYVLALTYAYHSKPFSVGFHLKWAGVRFYQYNAHALFLDLASTFFHPTKDLRIALVINNIGFILKNFTSSEIFNPPLDAQLGITYRPYKMPFDFSFTLHNLSASDIFYNDATQNNLHISLLNKITRYFVLATELKLIAGFSIYFGYNFLMRRELGGGIGIGFRIKVKKLNINYAYHAYKLGQSNQALTFSFNTKNIIKRKKIVN